MRKLKLQTQISVDGFIAGPNGEMDWVVWNWDDELKNYVTALTEPVDCILLGRVLAEGFIPTWAARAAHPENAEDEAAARKFCDTHKVVFSTTLERSQWDNTDLATGDIVEEVTRLKQQSGGDLIAYGGATFVSNLIQHGLIDELHLFVNPVALGSGMAIFNDRTVLKLVASNAFGCGIVVHTYEPVRQNSDV